MRYAEKCEVFARSGDVAGEAQADGSRVLPCNNSYISVVGRTA